MLMKMVIGEYIGCDYFGIELLHCVCEDFSSYVAMIIFFY